MGRKTLYTCDQCKKPIASEPICIDVNTPEAFRHTGDLCSTACLLVWFKNRFGRS